MPPLTPARNRHAVRRPKARGNQRSRRERGNELQRVDQRGVHGVANDQRVGSGIRRGRENAPAAVAQRFTDLLLGALLPRLHALRCKVADLLDVSTNTISRSSFRHVDTDPARGKRETPKQRMFHGRSMHACAAKNPHKVPHKATRKRLQVVSSRKLNSTGRRVLPLQRPATRGLSRPRLRRRGDIDKRSAAAGGMDSGNWRCRTPHHVVLFPPMESLQ